MKQTLSILISSRDSDELNSLQLAVADGCPGFHIDARLVSNGHVDPLHSVTTLPDVLLLGLSANWKEELQELAIRPADQRPPLIVIAPNREPEVMRLCMRAGARDFYTRPVDVESIIVALQQIARENAGHRGHSGKLTALINAKGGSGATLLASNIAHILACELGKRVAVVDLDIQFGSLALYLDLQPRSGLLEALDNATELDAVALEAYMETHSSGLRVLGTAHKQMPLADDIHIAHLQRIIDILADSFDHVIIDLPRQIDALTTTVMEQVDKLVLVTQQGIADVRDAGRLRTILYDDLGVPDDRLMVVVNRYDPNGMITLDDVETGLGSSLRTFCIANDHKRVRDNVNLGIPLFEQKASAPVSRSLLELARAISDENEQDKKPAGILARMFGKSTQPMRRLS